MENKADKKIDIKKVISIILSISIISCIIVVSCYASVETINVNTKYNYQSNRLSTVQGTDTNDYQYTGHYKGKAFIGNTENIGEYDVDFIALKSGTSSATKVLYAIYITDNNNEVQIAIKNNKTTLVDGIITFYTIGNNSAYNSYFQSTLTERDTFEDVYDENDNFLLYSVNTVKSLINYMITNNIILIVIAIVIVSFAVGTIIRITRKKF